jgi:hypothetical protein
VRGLGETVEKETAGTTAISGETVKVNNDCNSICWSVPDPPIIGSVAASHHVKE